MSQSTASSSSDPNDLPPVLRLVGAVALIAGLCFIAYAPSLQGGYVWDDDYYVYENPALTSFVGLQQIWFDILRDPADYILPQYYPLTHTSFWIEYRLWGLNPTGYHLVNLALHIGSALLVWVILRKLAVPGALLVAAVFAVHPVHVESVAWISERKNTLSLLFLLLSLYVYLRYVGLIAGSEKPNAKLALPQDPRRMWAIGLVLFLAALAAKTTAAALPAIVLLLVWWKRGRIDLKRDGLPMVPLFLIGFAAGQLTRWLEVHRVGAAGAEWTYAPTPIGQFAAETLIAGRAAWFYFGKLVVPYPTMFNYPRWAIDPTSALQWVWPVAAAVVIAVLFLLRHRIGRAPITGVLFFVGVLFPALGYFAVLPHRYSFVADHFQYVASLGLLTLLVGGAAWWWDRRRLSRPLGIGISAAVLATLTVLSFRQAQAYQSESALWRDTLAKNPQSWLAANNLGALLIEQAKQPDGSHDPAKLQRAKELFAYVLEIKPDHTEARYNLGRLVELGGGPRGDAIAWYREAVETNRLYSPAWHELGLHYQQMAREQRLRANELSGWDKLMYAPLHRQAMQRYLQAAQECYQRSIAAQPRYLPSVLQLGSLYIEYASYPDAIPVLERALQIDARSEQARNNLAFALDAMGRSDEAIGWWQEIINEDPQNVRVRQLMGVSFAKRGMWQPAIEQFQAAVRIDPRFAEGWYNLGYAQFESGDAAAGVQSLARAEQLGYRPAASLLQRIRERGGPVPAPTPAPNPQP
jgi:tetratricopeptide (TPR) repeat protein